MSAFTMGKVRIPRTCGQSLLSASLLLLVLGACGPDAARTVLVQADTTGGSVPVADTLNSPQEPESLPLGEASAEEPRSTGGSGPRSGGRGGSDRQEGPRDADETEIRARQAAARDREPGGRPPPPILLASGSVLLPAETILAAELRTPLHTATTVVGDRFAARLTQAVAAGGRVVIPVGALVEGRVSHIGNANEPGHIAFLHLEPRKVQMADGRRLRISADILDMTGQEVVEPGRNGRRGVPAAANALAQTGAAAEARRAMLGSVLIGLAGRVVVAPTADKEIIVPAGTTFTLQLVEPLEIPSPR